MAMDNDSLLAMRFQFVGTVLNLAHGKELGAVDPGRFMLKQLTTIQQEELATGIPQSMHILAGDLDGQF